MSRTYVLAELLPRCPTYCDIARRAVLELQGTNPALPFSSRYDSPNGGWSDAIVWFVDSRCAAFESARAYSRVSEAFGESGNVA